MIDRYAALDAALSRLTRTMMSARAISRRNDSVASEQAKPEPVPAYDEEEAVSPAFDVVLPEEIPAAHVPSGEFPARNPSRCGRAGNFPAFGPPL